MTKNKARVEFLFDDAFSAINKKVLWYRIMVRG